MSSVDEVSPNKLIRRCGSLPHSALADIWGEAIRSALTTFL
jgi:hypothetical protein